MNKQYLAVARPQALYYKILKKYTQKDIKKVFLIGIGHRLQIDYQKTLPTVVTDIRIPIITIPIYNG